MATNVRPDKIEKLIEMQEDPKVKEELRQEWETFSKYFTVQAAPSKAKAKEKAKRKEKKKAKAARQDRKQNRKK